MKKAARPLSPSPTATAQRPAAASARDGSPQQGPPDSAAATAATEEREPRGRVATPVSAAAPRSSSPGGRVPRFMATTNSSAAKGRSASNPKTRSSPPDARKPSPKRLSYPHPSSNSPAPAGAVAGTPRAPPSRPRRQSSPLRVCTYSGLEDSLAAVKQPEASAALPRAPSLPANRPRGGASGLY